MFDLTEDEYRRIIKQAMLNEELTKILEMKIKGEYNSKIAQELHMSERTLSRRIEKLKKKVKRVL